MLAGWFGGDEKGDERAFLGSGLPILFLPRLHHQDREESSSPILTEQDFQVLGFSCFESHPISVGEKGAFAVTLRVAFHEVVYGMFLHVVLGAPCREEIIHVPMGLENGFPVHGNPKQVVGFPHKPVFSGDRGGKPAPVADYPKVWLHPVRHLEDLGGFRGIANGDENLGGPQFFWHDEVLADRPILDAAPGKKATDGPVKIGIGAPYPGGFFSGGVELEVDHGPDQVVFLGFLETEKGTLPGAGFFSRPRPGSARSSALSRGSQARSLRGQGTDRGGGWE